ncbi:MAG: sugar phosphate isomerase/epimerase family protein [Pseudomonadota bacterium]
MLRALKAVGYDGVEVPIFDASDPAHYRRLGQILDDIGLERTIVALLPDEEHSAISPNAAHRRGAISHLRSVVECGAELGATLLVGPYYQALGQFTGERPTETELAHGAAVHREIAQIAETSNMVCALEPLNRFEAHLLNTCEQATSYAARVGAGNLGVLYDTFHANIEEKDPIGALRALHASGWLRHVHISENDRGTPGRGHAPLRETISVLKSLGYDGWLTIEAFSRGVPALAAATRVWRDFSPNLEQVYEEGFALIQRTWAEA